MQPSEPLRNLLENRARDYTGGEVEVEFDEQPRITQDGETVYVWTSPGEVLGIEDRIEIGSPNEFRVIRDALNHECAHYRWSDLAGKETFMGRYPDYKRLAGAVCNRLEDSYIDSRRLSGRDGWPGLRQAHAFFTESQVADAPGVDELDRANALVKTIDYYGLAGRVPGIRDADDEVRTWAAWVKPRIDELRRTDDAADREAIMTEIMDALVSRLPDKPDLDDLADAIAEAASGDVPDEGEVEDASETVEAGDESAAPEDLPDPEDLEPDDVELADDEAEADAELDADELPEDVREELAEQAEDDAQGDAGDGDDSEDAEGGDAAGDDEQADADENGEQGGDDAEGEDKDTDGESGDEFGGETEGRSTGDEGESEAGKSSEDADADLMDELAELDERDERGESPEFHGADPESDYDEASESDARRYERVEDEAVYANETDIGQRKANRDERAERASLGSNDATGDQVRQVLRESGLADDIRRAFEKFATLDVTVRDETGDRINTEAAVRHMAGDYSETQVYETDYTAATGGRVIGVALDISNSMKNDGSDLVHDVLDGGRPEGSFNSRESRGAIVDAKVALGSIHLATHELGDELVSSAFHAPGSTARTPLITGPGESFSWDHLDSVTYGGTTPTAHAVLDVLELIRDEGGSDEIMLVVTDGLPKDGHPDLPGSTYAEDAAIAVQTAREQGVGVIGIGVGDRVREGKMKQMFGEGGYVTTESEDLVSELINIYADELDYERPPGY